MKEIKLKDADISVMFKTAKIKQCPDEASIVGLADGSASRLEREKMQAHCNDCPSCRELLNDLKLLYTVAPREPLPSFKQRFAALIGSRQAGEPDLVLSLVQSGLQVIKSLLSPAPAPVFAMRGKAGTVRTSSFVVKALNVNWQLEFRRGRGRLIDLLISAEKKPKGRANVSISAGNKTLKSYSYSGQALSFNNFKPGRYQLQWQEKTLKTVNFVIEG